MTDRQMATTLDTKVSRTEELLYGPYAALVRRLGNFATAAEQARAVLEEALGASREADTYTSGPEDERGRSPHTAMLDEWYEKLWPVVGAALEAHGDLTLAAQEAYRAARQSVDSQPACPPPQDVRVGD